MDSGLAADSGEPGGELTANSAAGIVAISLLGPGPSSAAHDIGAWTVGAQEAFRLTQADVLSGSLFWRDGSVTAVSLPNLGVLGYSGAAVVDGTFSDDRRRIACRVDAGTTMATLAWSRALGQSATVNASYTRRSSRADNGPGTYLSDTFGIALGYIYVADSPWCGKTGDNGRVQLDGLPRRPLPRGCVAPLDGRPGGNNSHLGRAP